MSRDNITEFPLWKLVPPERGVAKCDTDHDQGFVLITILVFFNMTCPMEQVWPDGAKPMSIPESS